jgi:hypothetical protein
MAGMTTVLTEFSDKENSRTYALTGHSVLAPRLVIQKRKVPSTSSGSPESRLSVIYGTTDAEGNPLQSKVAFDVGVRYPSNGQASDVSAALAILRDIVAGDEFTAMVNSQLYVS